MLLLSKKKKKPTKKLQLLECLKAQILAQPFSSSLKRLCKQRQVGVTLFFKVLYHRNINIYDEFKKRSGFYVLYICVLVLHVPQKALLLSQPLFLSNYSGFFFLKKRKVKSLKTFNLYSRDKNCEPRGGSKQLLHHNTARRTFITRENIRIHILARTHACAHMKTNVTRNRN